MMNTRTLVPQMAGWNPDMGLKGQAHVYPWHSGSIKYLKEKGVWAADDDARQEYNLRLLQPYIDAWDKALDRAARQGVKVSPESVEFAELWSSVKEEMSVPGYRTMDSEQIKEGLTRLDQLGF